MYLDIQKEKEASGGVFTHYISWKEILKCDSTSCNEQVTKNKITSYSIYYIGEKQRTKKNPTLNVSLYTWFEITIYIRVKEQFRS